MPFIPRRTNLPTGVEPSEKPKGLTVDQAKTLLDAVAEDPTSNLSIKAISKLGINDQQARAWSKVQGLPEDDELRVKVRNKIFDTVADNLPVSQEGGGGADFIDRFKVKNFIDQDPILQQRYFEKKGYDVMHTPEGLMVRKPDSPVFQPLDPENVDRFDLFDLFTDIGEAVAVAGATSAKVLGALGAPVTGGASVAATAALGGATTGAYETAKQGAAIGMGLRDELDPGRITQKTLLGAGLPIAIKGAGKAVEKTGEWVGKGITKLYPLKQNAEQVIAAGKRLGVKPKLRQIFDSDTVNQLETSLEKVRGTIGGIRTRRAAQKFTKDLDDSVDSILGSYKSLDVADVGDKFKTQMVKSVKDELSPASALYDSIEKQFSRRGYKNINKDKISNSIDDLLDKYEFDKYALGKINEVKTYVDGLTDLNKLKDLRSFVGKEIKVASKAGEDGAVHSLGKLYNELTNVRSDTLKTLVEESKASPEFIQKTLDEIKAADMIYKNTAEAVQNALFKRGQSMRGGVLRAAKNFDEVVEDGAVIRKILSVNDPKRIEKFARDFPNEFELIRNGKLAEFVNQSSRNAEQTINAKTFLKKIDQLPRKTKTLLLGDDAIQKLEDLRTFLTSIPKELNPSGTSYNIESLKMIGSHFGSLARSARLKLLTTPRLQKDLLKKAGVLIQSPASIGAGEFTASQLLPKPVSDKQAMDRSLIEEKVFRLPNEQRTILPAMRR